MQTKKSCTFRLNLVTVEQLKIICSHQSSSQAELIELLVNKYWIDSKCKYSYAKELDQAMEQYPNAFEW